MNHEQIIDAVDEYIVHRSKTVIIAFLVMTVFLSVGFGMTATDSGTDQFTEDIDSQKAAEQISEDFSTSPFEGSDGATQYIQSNQNVLSKQSQIRLLKFVQLLSERPEQRIAGSSSIADVVAVNLDPTAETYPEKIDALQGATPTEVRVVTKNVLTSNPGLQSLLSTDYNSETVSASATLATTTHRIDTGGSAGAGTSGSSPMTDIQTQGKRLASSTTNDITVFGDGIFSTELGEVITDSLLIVVPAAALLIFIFLIFAYRDPIDLLIGVVALGMAVIWTFGFMGWAGIPFTQMLIAVPPLLLAVGIDFGIHAVNRYREERVTGKSPVESMTVATDQLLLAFFIVTGTTVIGFWVNLTSKLPPIQDFGLVAGIGIIFTFLIFGIFLPALKLHTDRWREAHPSIPQFGSTPLGNEGSILGHILPAGVVIAKYVPILFLVVVLVGATVGGIYGTGVDSQFRQEDFLPPEELNPIVTALPEPFAPSEYTVPQTLAFIEDNFESGESDSVSIYIEGTLRDDSSLEIIHRASQNPPSSFVSRDGEAEQTSIITIIDSYAAQNPSFNALVDQNDRNSNGIPDDNLETIYDALLNSPYESQAKRYISDDYRSTRVQYQIKSTASQTEVTEDSKLVANRIRYQASATGSIIILKDVSDIILESAIISLGIGLLITLIFLIVIYHVIERRPLLGVINMIPIIITITSLLATMRYLGIPLNALTGTILSIGIGLGVDYSAHVVHRFSEEYAEGDPFDALYATVRGTGGALTGSMLTTVLGIGVLVLAITPVLGQFGLLTALSILYSYLASILVLPATLTIWARFTDS